MPTKKISDPVSIVSPFTTEVCTEAHDLIHADRRDNYGSPLESFSRIARLWEVVLGVPITEEQVALCMVQMKVSRAIHGMQYDSLVDIAGYAGCIDLIRQERDSLRG